MKFGKITLVASAASLAVTPAASAAERVSAPVEGESEIGAAGGGTVGVLFVLAALTLAIFVSGSGGDDEPASP